VKSYFRFLLAFALFNHFIVDDDGAGDADDIGDIDIDDEKDDEAEIKTSTGEISTDELLKLKQKVEKSDSLIEDLKKDKEVREKKEYQNSIFKGLKDKYSTFDEEKVKEHLVEMYKTNPEKAESLNDANGWELVYLQNFAPKPVENDEIDFGRNSGGVDLKEEYKEKLSSGQALSLDEQTEFFK
jgi:hypothetical protein